jgi:hypothetical protein
MDIHPSPAPAPKKNYVELLPRSPNIDPMHMYGICHKYWAKENTLVLTEASLSILGVMARLSP